MPPKKLLAHLVRARDLAKQKKREIGDATITNIVALKDKSRERSWTPENDRFWHENSDWEESSASEDDIEMTDKDNDDLNFNAFSVLMKAAQDSKNFDSHKFSYSQGPELSDQQKQRHADKKCKLTASAKGSLSLTAGFLSTELLDTPETSVTLDSSPSSFSSIEPFHISHANSNCSTSNLVQYIDPTSELHQKRSDAIQDLEKKLASKKTNLQGQDLARHRAVLSFLKVQSRYPDRTRKTTATQVAECYGRGKYLAEKIVTWEIQWMTNRSIEEGKRGCHTKSYSWFNDEGVQLAVRECISCSGDKLSAQKLAKAVGEYLGSQTAISTVEDILEQEAISGSQQLSVGNRIRVRTAQKWLKRLGLYYHTVSKNVYIDGHERGDVVQYRQKDFLPTWAGLERRMVIFSKDRSWTKPLGLEEEEKPLVLVTHDESTFNANDGKRKIWKEKGKSPLRPKGRGKGIMVSEFLTPVGRLRIPDTVSDAELLHDSNWPLDTNQKPRRYCTELLEYGKDNYWDGDKMTDQTINLAIRIFPYAYPGCQALFAFDNASNHACFAENALLARKMNLGVGGKQPQMRDGFNDATQQTQSMVFSDDYPEVSLRGKPKGLKQVLTERGLWRSRAPDGSAFLLECPTSHNCPGCHPSAEGNCCARAVMRKQPNFQAQRSRLQEEVKATGNLVIFYPKFHCKLNFIERYIFLLLLYSPSYKY